MYDFDWLPSPRMRSEIGCSPAAAARSSARAKSKPTPWVWRGPTTLPKRKAQPGQAEHRRVAGDQRLARQLAGPVGRSGDQRAVILGGLVRCRARRTRRCPTRTGSASRWSSAWPRARSGSAPSPARSRWSVRCAARAMSGFEARWITTSWPSIAAASAAVSSTLPRTMRRRASPAWCARCHSRPDEKLSYSGHARGAGVGREQAIAEVAADEAGATDDEEPLTRELLRHRREYYRHFAVSSRRA